MSKQCGIEARLCVLGCGGAMSLFPPAAGWRGIGDGEGRTDARDESLLLSGEYLIEQSRTRFAAAFRGLAVDVEPVWTPARVSETARAEPTFWDNCMTAVESTRIRTPEATRRNRRRRLPFLAFGLSFFVAALYGGLWRLGWPLPHASRLGDLHGPLMICGFFGALIGLERSVALGKSWPFAAPLLSCLGGLAALAGAPSEIAAALFAAAGAILALGSLSALRDGRQLFTAVLAFAAGCWSVGSLVWLLTGAVAFAAPWWLLFLTLTIAAERLDMSRLLGVTRSGVAAFLGCVALLVAGAAVGLFERTGAALLGCGFVALAVWLLRHDIALRNPKPAPHLRFFGASMALGYLWMAVAGAGLLIAPPSVAPYGYDAALHAILIGFVLSMAFGHSVIVIPAITGAAAPYHRALYAGLALLHVSAAARVCGDLFAWETARLASGALTLTVLIAFVAVLSWRIKATR